MSLAITAWDCSFDKNFNEQVFEHRDSRLMNRQTKIALSVVRKLYAKSRGEQIQSDNLGVVLSNDIGPLEAISEYNDILKEKGYVGINPSKFPNIMSSTLLSRISVEIRAKGPCVPFLSRKVNKHALLYAIEQIKVGRCRAMLLIHITSKNDCFACLIEDEISYQERNMIPKILL